MTTDASSTPPPAAWYRGIEPQAWRALFAGGAGWMLDAMDVMLYTFALSAIRAEFHLTDPQAGLVASVTLVASALGGMTFGALSDRFGRVRMLMISICIYSVCTALTATSANLWQLLFWRVLVGLGMGGEWSAGSVLVAESWPAAHRGKAIGLMQSGWAIGTIFAALLSAAILPTWGWRPLFIVGVLPALLVVWMRRNLREPARPPAITPAAETNTSASPNSSGLRLLLNAPYLQRAILATLAAAMLLTAYWGLFTWLPTFLASPIEKGGAGLGVVKSTTWIIPMQIGAFAGYTSFGFFADRFGRKPALIVFVLGAAILVPIYGHSARSENTLMLLGPLIGFFGHGYFSVFGSMLAEMFPRSIRGAAQGFCYNAGRMSSAVAPWAIGALAAKQGLGPALALTSCFYILGAALILCLPETRGKDLT